MELDQLRTFIAIVEHGSFSRAAKALHFSQSTLSFHIRSLETTLGVELLIRGRNGCRPNAAGERLREYATRMLAIHDDAVRSVRHVAEGIEGAVSLAVSTVPGEYILPPVLAAFKHKFPEIRIEMQQSDSYGALSALRSRLCDVAVIGCQPADEDISCESLMEDEIVLVGRPASSVLAPQAQLQQDANALPDLIPTLILRESGSGTQTVVAGFLGTIPGFDNTKLDTMIVGSTESARRCALAGLGWAFVSRLAVQEDINRGDLEMHPLPGLPIRRTFWAAMLPANTSNNPVAHRLFTFIVQFFR
ncbi:MAG: LysR family transcriptional regulator [Myxococcales bacterium]|nr:LysR family transcriptional regulator [Myxococcales bacterium]